MATFLMWTVLLMATQTMNLIDADTVTCDSSFKPMTIFDENQYAVQWFVYAEYKIFWDNVLHATCQKYNFSVVTGTTMLNVTYMFKTLNLVPVTLNGKLTPTDPNQPAKFTLTSPDLKGPFKGVWWVMDTDYKTFSVVVSCTDQPIIGGIYYGILALTIAKNPSNETVTTIQNSMTSSGLKFTDLVPQNQKDCG